MSIYLGIEIGGSKLQIVVGDDQARIIARRRYHVQPANAARGIQQQIEAALATLLAAGSYRAIGVGFGGPVNRQTGAIQTSHQIEGWNRFPLAPWIQSISGLPVLLENDANTAALGEARSGAGRGASPVFYVTLGSGVGGGLVVDGQIYHGAEPGEAEIGHLRIGPSRQTLESLCSGWAVDEQIRQAIQREPGGVLAQEAAGLARAEARCLLQAMALGDASAKRIFRAAAEHLALGLSHVIHLFHPSIIVLGGGLALLGHPWRLAVEQSLAPLVMEAFAGTYRIALAELQEDSVPVGALHLARLHTEAQQVEP